MSRRNTGLPSLPVPSGSVVRFFSTVPAIAKATTSGGEARKFALRLGWMRASKLRLPDSTAAQTRSLVAIASLISAVRSPALPMHVVHPYAATLKPSRSRYVRSCAFSRYSVTTREPGASDVLTCGATVRPFSTAFFASSPAAISTLGLLVFVHDVIAAIRTSPDPIAMPVVWPGSETASGVGRLLDISTTSRGAPGGTLGSDVDASARAHVSG